MLIINHDINAHLQAEYNAAKSNIDVIAYSIARPRKGNHKLFIDTWRSLEMAIKRGIKTRFILETWPDFNPQASENNKVRIMLEQLGAQVRMAKKGIIMHGKTWQFDNVKLIIGSHNSTHAGLMSTQNLSILTHDLDQNVAYSAYFNNQWALNAPLAMGKPA